MIHHCARCHVDVHSGDPAGILYLIHPGGRAERADRFCQQCTAVLFEAGVSFKTPERVEEERLISA